MSPIVAESLQTQAGHERMASAAYLAMSFWCENAHYSGFAAFFKKQAEEEAEHAEKIYNHLLDRGILPVLGALPESRAAFPQLLDVAQLAFDLERANTAGIHAAYATAVRENDYPAQILLHWFISEQVEEEAWTDKMVAKVRTATCAGALLCLDRHISKELGE